MLFYNIIYNKPTLMVPFLQPLCIRDATLTSVVSMHHDTWTGDTCILSATCVSRYRMCRYSDMSRYVNACIAIRTINLLCNIRI